MPSDAPRAPIPGTRNPLLALQALRFLAAAMVVVHHAGYDADTLATRTGRPTLALDQVFDGSFGIHLFFVLSGFIMVFAERDFGVRGAPRRFATRRLIRVAPLYWLMTSLVLVGAWLAPTLLNTPVDDARAILGSYLFIPVMRSTGDSHPILGQGWTLAYEMMFYAAFAIAMTWSRRVGLSLLAIAFMAAVAAGHVGRPSVAALQVWTDPLLFEFLLGAGLALLYDEGLRLGGLTAALFSIGGLLLAWVLGPAFGLATAGPSWLLQGGPAALTLAGLAFGPPWPATWPVLALGTLGDASYSLYLSHPFAVRLLRDLWLRLGWARAPLTLYVIAASLVAVVVSLFLFRWIERPMTRALRRRFDAARGASVASAPSKRVEGGVSL